MKKGWKCLSGSALKLLAVLSMLVDHLAAFVWYDHAFATVCLMRLGDREVTPYFLMRCVGRIAFPIFAFLITEGFVHTRSRLRYGINLAAFALISEIPWNLVHSGTLLWRSQNVFFTLLLGYLGLCALERFRDDARRLALALFGLLAATYLVRADYGCVGYAFILMLYILREQPLFRAVLGSCMLPGRVVAGLAFIPLSMYDGERGFIRGPVGKYCFYAFYPLHLLLIWAFS